MAERATTIPKGSRTKWFEIVGTRHASGHDIVWSADIINKLQLSPNVAGLA